jgi:hypothetical protein
MHRASLSDHARRLVPRNWSAESLLLCFASGSKLSLFSWNSDCVTGIKVLEKFLEAEEHWEKEPSSNFGKSDICFD